MKTVKCVILIGITFWIGCAPGFAQTQTTVTIATVNNEDMIRMRELSEVFPKF